MLIEFLANTLSLYLDAATWLLLGLVAAGLIKAWIPERLMNRWLGGRGYLPVLKAALIGAPLPLCSCGVVPAALGLRRAGASKGATVSFLIATPETGVDSVAVTYALMGPFMAVLRPIAAVISAVFTGLLAATVPEQKQSPLASIALKSCSGGCCGSNCNTGSTEKQGKLAAARQGLVYAATDLLDDVSLWMGVGLLAAGAVITFLPPDALAEWAKGPLAMGVMLLVGIPMYICATASTPLAASLLLVGVSPGTVLVFLLAGPATNVGTLALLRKELGTRVLTVYLGGIALTSVGLGLFTDWMVGWLEVDIVGQLVEGGEAVPESIAWASALLLLTLAIRPLRRQLALRLSPLAG